MILRCDNGTVNILSHHLELNMEYDFWDLHESNLGMGGYG